VCVRARLRESNHAAILVAGRRLDRGARRPVHDIAKLRRINQVYVRGSRLDRESLRARWTK
jgi:hypothetical protein